MMICICLFNNNDFLFRKNTTLIFVVVNIMNITFCKLKVN